MTALPLVMALAAAPTVELTAERLLHDDTRKITTAEGDAELVAQGAALHADRITWDEGSQAATASGRVALRLTRRGLLAIVADVVTVRMTGDDVSEVFIYDGLALRKKNTTAEGLLAARSQDAARAIGSNTMSLVATHLRRDEGGDWIIEDLEFTPCDCDLEKPMWRIGTARTTLDLVNERASVLFPVVYVRNVPLLWFPWLSLPLSDRQTGLLVPRPTFTALNGFGLEAPVFITLGRSADVTLTPGYFFGGSGVYGIAGPRLLTEFRYAPSAGTSGRATLGLLYDTRDRRNPTNPALTTPGPRGLRADGSLIHTQELGKGFHDRINASFLSDGYLQRDFTPDVLAREAGYLRSTAALFHRGDDHWAGFDVSLRQDLSTGYGLFDPLGPNPVQRLPALTLFLPTRKLAGPLSFGVRGELARLAPTFRTGGAEGHDRLDVMPRLDLAGVLGGALGVSAFAAWRQDVWFGEISKTFAVRGYPLLGGRIETELARTFSDSVRHTIAPSLEVRAVPAVLGRYFAKAYDEIDDAVPSDDPFVQGVAMIRQRLLYRRGGTVTEALRLDLGQGFDLLRPRLSETFAKVGSTLGPFSAAASARFDPNSPRLTRLTAVAAVDDGRGTGVYVTYENLLDDGTDRSRQNADLLFGLPANPTDGRPQILTLGAHWRYGGFGARYDGIFTQVTRNPGGTFLQPAQHTIGVSYGPDCNDCWRVDAFCTFRGAAFPDLGANLTITGFGTLGSGG